MSNSRYARYSRVLQVRAFHTKQHSVFSLAPSNAKSLFKIKDSEKDGGDGWEVRG